MDQLAIETREDVRESLLVYWGGVGLSISTLFQSISGGESWRYCVLPLQAASPLIAFGFYVFIAFTYFAVLNVVTGVFCSSAIETAQRNPDLIAHAMSKARLAHDVQLKELFEALDVDGTQELTFRNLEVLLNDPLTQAYFAAAGLDVSKAWTLFKLLDVDGGGTIEIDEFLHGCSQLRGAAKSLEIAAIRYDLRILAGRVMKFISDIEGSSAQPQ